jgi:hypothetical protein
MTTSYVVKPKKEFVADTQHEYFFVLDEVGAWMHQFDSYGLYQPLDHQDGLIKLTYPAMPSEPSFLVHISHAQFLVRGQRKYKKSNKERRIDRHYDLDKKPSYARQQVNRHQHQGRNKAQFCSQR